MNIIVYDDQGRRASEWVAQIDRALDETCNVSHLSAEDFENAVKTLEARRRMARDQEAEGGWDPSCVLDNCSCLVIDYDLMVEFGGVAITGETVAYLARCYSRCGWIIGVNQFGEVGFDLALPAHLDSFADINVREQDLSLEGLWRHWQNGFRPWSWRPVREASAKLEETAAEVKGRLDNPLKEFFAFPDTVVALLPSPLVADLQVEKPIAEVTFREVANSPGLGLRPKDRPYNDESVARIAAARIGRWLRDRVLVRQDILVDAPHMVNRLPSLLAGDKQNVGEWNKLVTDPHAALKEGAIADFGFSREDWLSIPAWWWPLVSEAAAVDEIRDPWSYEPPGFVFCEDSSRFVHRESAIAFDADFDSVFARRYIANQQGATSEFPDGILYAGRHRLVSEP